ncbi:MAG: MtN3/saliva family [Candidatus Giovannonibacteria bacterium GW2011_GWC2_44_9]|uniref:MtN3/saliva family n=3 Tax=Candidatus Giovannoniibacteriota TaxID=1752738 RepID=A0A0G1IYU7_9BACT|nr:MAG: MtN3/saliva family [Candidatus Giovannonibacteria bacterium GW2011_GWB1_44_23]KKT64210.1 MAG: MtN3/saliva family [Candidatus Giovannonibacteria bacterium GW2011_GWA1_44_29]KKT84447.1 MAG: MtN3/saliva family [Candidatus Giovannonibacteria bacterium GW2011_GWC2_44_9]KKT91811.1 MAG: MtN3/saliva family [Parcubacteria group bacterium GW2011_GWC1_45_13]
MSVSYFPQAWKQLKNKSAHNIAIATFTILLIGKIIWFFYGIQINDFPVIVSNLVSVIGLLAIVVLYFIYRER